MTIQIRSVPALRPIPTSWQVDPTRCEYLGSDAVGAEYWCITTATIAPGVVGREVMRHQDGASRWVCSWAAWPTYCQIYPVTQSTEGVG